MMNNETKLQSSVFCLLSAVYNSKLWTEKRKTNSLNQEHKVYNINKITKLFLATTYFDF